MNSGYPREIKYKQVGSTQQSKGVIKTYFVVLYLNVCQVIDLLHTEQKVKECDPTNFNTG